MKEVIIIGAGPIGLCCAIEAQKRNLDYLLIEKGTLVNSIYNYPINMTFFSTSEKIEIGEVPFIAHNSKPTKEEALEYYRRVALHWKLFINLYEKVLSFASLPSGGFSIKTSKGVYKTKNIVIATGFYDFPYLLNIPGEELSKVSHYYKDAHPYFGMDVAIVGAGNSAVDVALEIYRKGAKSVTMIIREKEIGKNIKYWVRPDIINRIKESTIKAYFNAELTKIALKEICIKTPTKEVQLKNDFVLAMTGYQPNFTLLKSLGISFGSDTYNTPIYNKETMESNVSAVYLAGVVCGGLKTNKWFIENSRIHAPIIMEHIRDKLAYTK